MNNLRRFYINQIQRYHRRLNTAYLESVYQTSYLNLAQRSNWVDEVPMASPNGGTASFSLLYIIMSILKDKSVSSMMELGVGQSTSLLKQYVANFGDKLLLVDDDEYWLNLIAGEHAGVETIFAELTQCTVGNKSIDWYDCSPPETLVDFLLVDGPKAYKWNIRYNRHGILNWLPEVLEKDFVIIIDDTNRLGEYQLVRSIIKKLAKNGIEVGMREIIGANAQTIIATKKYTKYLYL